MSIKPQIVQLLSDLLRFDRARDIEIRDHLTESSKVTSEMSLDYYNRLLADESFVLFFYQLIRMTWKRFMHDEPLSLDEWASWGQRHS